MSKADEGRLIHIAKKRERAKEAIEQRRRKIELETKNCLFFIFRDNSIKLCHI